MLFLLLTTSYKKNMKIAILSMHRVLNYGSVLQAYSLHNMLEELSGSQVDFIDPCLDKEISVHMPVQDTDDYSSTPYLCDGKVRYYFKKAINKLKYKKFVYEVKKYQNNVLKVSSENNNKRYDLVVEGSDEVFKATKKLYTHMYGYIDNTNHLITYAASCGSTDYSGLPSESIKMIRLGVSNFELMSVRDFHTQEYISKLYSGNIEMHLDPVLMGSLYARKHEPVPEKNYMVIYAYGDRIRNKEEIEEIKTYAKRKKLKIIAIGAPQYWADTFIPAAPFRVLDYFYFADCVVTDTFHGTIFSIINKCKFSVILRSSNRNKLIALLEQLGLQGQIMLNTADIPYILDKNIDYATVDKVLARERSRTRDYLKKAINLAK